jgi:hypothetical protein
MTEAQPRRQPTRRSRSSDPRYHAGPDAARWDARYAPSPGVTWSVAGGEAVVSNPDTGSDYTLNSVGTAVWELLDGHRPLAAVAGAVAESFDVAPTTVRRDLLALLTRLEAEGLVERR